MQWIITDDLIGDDPNVIGKGTLPKGTDPQCLPYRFRLLDADEEVYYLGRSDDMDSQAAFEPLDWAQGHAGCTEIQFWREGRWVPL